MRKQYIRPEAFYESYVLAQHVAKCGWDMQEKSETECVANPDYNLDNIPDDGDTLFTVPAHCVVLKEDYKSYCYTDSTENIRVFNS